LLQIQEIQFGGGVDFSVSRVKDVLVVKIGFPKEKQGFFATPKATKDAILAVY